MKRTLSRTVYIAVDKGAGHFSKLVFPAGTTVDVRSIADDILIGTFPLEDGTLVDRMLHPNMLEA